MSLRSRDVCQLPSRQLLNVKRLFVSRDGNANGQKLVAVNREPKWGSWTMMMPWIAMAHLFLAGAQMLAAWLRPSRSFVNLFYS